MLLAASPLQPSYTNFARSVTFPKSGVFVARERLRQVAGHQARRNTMAATCSKEDAHDDSPNKAAASGTNKQAAETSSAEKPAESKSGAVDIDQDVEDKYNQLPLLPSPLPKAHRDFVHCKPPDAPIYRKFSVFTAGSIEMGKAVQWQKQMALLLSPLPITVNNPRRGHWDPNATSKAKDASFRHQVEWELGALEQADVICFFFDCDTKSPVTMLELGLWAASDKVIVCCDKRFWRSGNVQIVCERYAIPFVDTFEDLVPAVKNMLVEKGMQLDHKGDLVGENVHVEKPKPKKKTELEAEKAELQRQVDALQAQLATSRI